MICVSHGYYGGMQQYIRVYISIMSYFGINDQNNIVHFVL